MLKEEKKFYSSEARVKRTDEDLKVLKRLSPKIHSRTGYCWCGINHQ